MWIIKLSFTQTDHPFYYVRVNGENWEEIYNPHFATQFKTGKDAVNWIKENMTFQEEHAIAVGAVSTINKYDKWINGPAVRRTFNYPSKELNVKYDPDKHDKFDVLDWWFTQAKTNDSEVKYEIYTSYPKPYELFECLWDVKSYGYDEKRTIGFEMCVRPTTPFDLFESELNLIIDRVSHRNENGDLTISIFDRFLSESGNTVNFEIRNDDTYAITNRIFDVKSGTLEEVFEYWKAERYYE